MRTFIATCLIALVAGPACAGEGPSDGPGRHRGQLRERAIERFDADKDGTLDEAERAAARDALAARHGGKHGAGRGRLFDRIDRDDDGSISREEFLAGRRHRCHRRGGADTAGAPGATR